MVEGEQEKVQEQPAVQQSSDGKKSAKIFYGAENIQVLEGLDPVRKRPGMYIGSTGLRGLHHLVYEIVDNSIDEAMAGFCKSIIITIHKDNSITVVDDGRGIPIDIHPHYKKSGLTIALTMLHAGGKFDKNTYKVSGGLHGVGASVVNALSEKLIATVKRDGVIVQQVFHRGVEETPTPVKLGDSHETGTTIDFWPDPQIFESIIFDYDTLALRLRELAFLNKGIIISLSDERTGASETYQYKGGIKEYVEYLNKNKKVLHPAVSFEKEKDGITIEIGIQYNTTYAEQVFSYANNINTHEGGSHLTGFRTALTRTINSYATKQKIFKDDTKFTSDDMKEGLTAVVSVKVPEPQFEGQTKTKLGNSNVKGIVENLFGDAFTSYLEETPSAGKAIISKCFDAMSAREAARKAKDLIRRKSLLEGSRLPGKLSDCSSKNMEECEIYCVEGDSAGGSAKQARKKEFQAILPLKGKIINVEKARLIKVLKNDEIITLITALGVGVGDDFDAKKLRYGKVIVMTDADVDGNHIACLILTFFYRYMKDLILQGRIYLAQPPLYKLQKGKVVKYAYSEQQKDGVMKDLGDSVSVQRYKGLGEMNPEQLWETTMDPDVRTLKKIMIEDALLAEEMFVKLMGDEVEPRKHFIMTHAKEVKELDV